MAILRGDAIWFSQVPDQKCWVLPSELDDLTILGFLADFSQKWLA